MIKKIQLNQAISEESWLNKREESVQYIKENWEKRGIDYVNRRIKSYIKVLRKCNENQKVYKV